MTAPRTHPVEFTHGEQRAHLTRRRLAASGMTFEPEEKTMRKIIQNLMRDESGASLIEYVLLAALIGVAAIVGMRLVGTNAQAELNNAAVEMARP